VSVNGVCYLNACFNQFRLLKREIIQCDCISLDRIISQKAFLNK